MSTKSIYTILIIFSLILIISCNGEKEYSETNSSSPRIRKNSKVVFPETNARYVLGDTVFFEIESKADIDSLLLDYDGNTTIYSAPDFHWIADNAKTGIQKFRLTVYNNGTGETHYPKVKFFSDVAPESYTYEIVNTYPHSEEAYTQGLFFLKDTLVESTGRKGQSVIRKVNLNDGSTYQAVNLPSQYFGEGSTVWNDKIVQLTWTSQQGFVYNHRLEQTGTFHYAHEGWGITTYGDTLVVSDGTEILHLLDPRDYSEFGQLEVYTDQNKVINLNELEVINGLIYANVWYENYIVAIDPSSGKVLQEINMDGLADLNESREADALNGIAYKASTDQIFVTGKLWPKLFEVNFIPK